MDKMLFVLCGLPFSPELAKVIRSYSDNFLEKVAFFTEKNFF